MNAVLRNRSFKILMLLFFFSIQLPANNIDGQGNLEQLLLSAKSSKDAAAISTEICINAVKATSTQVLVKCRRAIKNAREAEADSLLVINLSMVGFQLHLTKGVDEAYPYLKEVKDIAENFKRKTLLPPAYYYYATLYERYIDLDSAFNYLWKAYEIADEHDDQLHMIKTLSGIGYLQFESGEFIGALENFSKALELSNEIEDLSSVALMYGYKAMAFRELSEYDKSEEQFKLALDYYLEVEDKLSTSRIHFGIAKLESLKGNYQKSNQILQENVVSKYKNLQTVKYSKELIAANHYRLGEYSKALTVYQDIEQSLDKIRYDLYTQRIMKGLAECYEVLGDKDMALQYYKSVVSQDENLLKNKISNAVNSSQLHYKLNEIAFKNERLIEIGKHKNQIFFMFLVLAALLCVGFLWIFDYLRKRNRLLQELSHDQEKVNSDLQSKTQQRDSQNQLLINRNHELSIFAGTVAHDIKIPILTNNKFIQLLRRHVPTNDKVNQYLDYIEKTNIRISQIISDLLIYARSGQYDKQAVPIDLNVILSMVEGYLGSKKEDAKMIITAVELPVIYAHETAMIQLFQNLLSNSIKFCDKDRMPQIDITVSAFADRICICIKDNGIGIKDKFRHKIFEPFIRLNAEANYEGSGLGLASCKKIVEYYHGSLEVRSEIGVGSTFTIFFPLDMIISSKKSEIHRQLQ